MSKYRQCQSVSSAEQLVASGEGAHLEVFIVLDFLVHGTNPVISPTHSEPWNQLHQVRVPSSMVPAQGRVQRSIQDNLYCMELTSDGGW